MSSIRVESTIADLESDCRKVATSTRGELVKVVREATRVGNTVAKDNARRTADKHGKLYPRSFSTEVKSFFGFGGGEIVGIYGPDASKPQGGMSFEYGSRNQPPHLDLNKSADLIGPAFAGEVRDVIERLFWPT